MMIFLTVAQQGLLIHPSKLCYLENQATEVSILLVTEVLTANTHYTNKAIVS